MADTDHNPLAPMDDATTQKVRERAYHLWEADGCPDDRAAEYWDRAETLTRMETGAHSGELPNPATLPGADPLRTQPIEEASIQENLGEFPDRLSDQGERQATPRRQKTTAA
jgi:hypothetical protein